MIPLVRSIDHRPMYVPPSLPCVRIPPPVSMLWVNMNGKRGEIEIERGKITGVITKKMKEIEDKGLILQIKEYGELKRQYHDTNHKRFMENAHKIIDDHLRYHSGQDKNEVRNITINLYTY